MFFHFSAEDFYNALAQATANGVAVAYGDQVDEAYQSWAEAMANYAAQGVVQAQSVGDSVVFWVVVQLPKEDFSDKLDFHEKIPMMMPAEDSGVLLGIAKSGKELDQMTTDSTGQHVHLVYKIRLQGQKSWRTLLEFLGEHNMIERESG
jgi:hypothetical protein